MGIFHYMEASIRHMQDLEFNIFLNIIRTMIPTEAQIQQYLGDVMITHEEALRFIDKDTTILGTHKDDVQRYNDDLLNRGKLARNG